MERKKIKRRSRVTVKRIPTSEDPPVKWALLSDPVAALYPIMVERGKQAWEAFQKEHFRKSLSEWTRKQRNENARNLCCQIRRGASLLHSANFFS